MAPYDMAHIDIISCHRNHDDMTHKLWTIQSGSNYENLDLRPPSGQKLFLKIMIFSTFFHSFDPRLTPDSK